MKLPALALAPCLGLPLLGGCALYDDSGTPDPGLYWGWVCPDGGAPVDASAPIDYLASGSCGGGGPFTVSVDGCEMSGSWSALGLSDVATTRYAASPSLGGWVVSGTEGAEGEAGAGVSVTCTASVVQTGGLTFTCTSGTSTVTCQSNFTPPSGS